MREFADGAGDAAHDPNAAWIGPDEVRRRSPLANPEGY